MPLSVDISTGEGALIAMMLTRLPEGLKPINAIDSHLTNLAAVNSAVINFSSITLITGSFPLRM